MIAKGYTWDRFAKEVYLRVNQHYFSPQHYHLNHDHDLSLANWNFWRSRVDQNVIEVPYEVKIPNNFNSVDYANDHNLTGKNPQYIYVHWYLNGHDRDYMRRNVSNQTNLSGSLIKTHTSLMFELFNGFNMIEINRNI